MIQLTPQMRILVAVEAQDFRKGIDGLARVCREGLAADPFDGALFVFRNRARRSSVSSMTRRDCGSRGSGSREAGFDGGPRRRQVRHRSRPINCSD
jgi:transposase